jgi:acetate kinase
MVLEGSAQGIGRPDGSLRIRAAGGDVLAQADHVMESQPDALRALVQALETHGYGRPAAVGHRIVHGGPRLRAHQRLTPAVLDTLRQATHFAPLHIPAALRLIEQAQAIFTDAPHFGCFDNAFYEALPERARRLPLPGRYTAQGVIRYGFHGLSYESLVHRLGPDLPRRAVLAHLGNGSSLCALEDGRPVDTSMGMTPTGGLPMSTRSGDLDPGVLLYLMRAEALDADRLEQLLNRDSGLAGLASGESDMRALLARAGNGDAEAELAVDIFATAARKYVGAYAAVLGGLDLLVFTGGIGEHAEEIRRRICAGLGFLGIAPDRGGKVRVMATEEERQMARHCRRLLREAAG